MTTEETIDKYEEIFGIAKYQTLFSGDDEEYLSLRTEIMSSPKETYKKSSLPFDGVALVPYSDYAIELSVAKMREGGRRIFRIIDEELGVCAYGEYLPFSRNFVLLEYSKVHITENTKEIYRRDHKAFRMNHATFTDVLTENIVCKSASLAASYVMGHKTSFKKWLDETTGERLYDVYSTLGTDKAEKWEQASFPKKQVLKEQTICFVEEEAVEEQSVSTETVETSDSQEDSCLIFHLKKPGMYKANGYYDITEKSFNLMRGSFFNCDLGLLLDKTVLCEARDRFIKTYCRDIGGYYLLTKNVKLLPSIAASYVMGEKKELDVWVTDDGKHLYDVYVGVFSNPNEEYTELQLEEENVILDSNVFYLKMNAGIFRTCNAIGKYVKTAGSMVLMKGSAICLNVVESFKNTSGYAKRNEFIRSSCLHKQKTYEVCRDITFPTPSSAATFVLGRFSNGWMDWKDKEGRTLKECFPKNKKQ